MQPSKSPSKIKARKALVCNQISDLLLTNPYISVVQIAKELNYTRKTVIKHLEEIEAYMVADTMFNMKKHKAKHLIRLESVQSEAWLAWHKSKEPITRKEISKKGKDNNDNKSNQSANKSDSNLTQNIVEIQRDPNSKYLEIVVKCEELKMRIFGTESPKKIIPDSVELEIINGLLSGTIQESEVIENLGEQASTILIKWAKQINALEKEA